ncbi:MAG: cation diffusion facilitator family transporter, partial [Lentimicrobiaceae bacterium]|nr:cation diffusion facilitator family transporter [Lentimicrobiaceae bacterium]
LLFIKGQKNDLNIRGAFLHMAADAAVSLGVVAAGLAIYLTGLPWIDPLISFVIILIILYSTWNLFIESIDLALDAVPKHIHLDKVHDYLLSQPGVKAVHDLHIWAMSTTQVALTAHLYMPGGGNDQFIATLQHQLNEHFDIGHTTFQIETEPDKIHCAPDC